MHCLLTVLLLKSHYLCHYHSIPSTFLTHNNTIHSGNSFLSLTNQNMLYTSRCTLLKTGDIKPNYQNRQLNYLICKIYLWNESHLTPSHSTTPDVISSSAKYCVSIPSSSCFLNWIPDVVSSSIESCAYISSLKTEKNIFTICRPHWL